MNFPISLHYFYYGPFDENDEEYEITEYFGRYISQTKWWKVTTCIEDPQGNPVTDHIDVASLDITNVKAKKVTINTAAEATAILREEISKHGVGLDPNDIYILWLHDDIAAQFLCTDANGACGYHYYFNNSNGNIKYIIIGGGGEIGMQCAPCQGPNGPWGAFTNQMVNSLANQLVRTVSDPVPYTGWYDPDNQENGQKCAGQFLNSQAFRPDKETNWNIVLGGGGTNHWFLIQSNWDVETSKCVMYPSQDCSVIAPSRPQTSAPHDPGSATGLRASILSVFGMCSVLFGMILFF
jgi:hypothetical protein